MLRQLLLFPLCLALCTVALVGCDSNDEDDRSVLGRWEVTDDEIGTVYANISASRFVSHVLLDFDDPGIEDCFIMNTSEVVDRDGDEWTLRVSDGPDEDETVTISIRRDGDFLEVVGEDGEVQRLERSTRTDFSPECDF